MKRSRGAAPLVGNLLLVAVAIVMLTIVAVGSLGLLDRAEPAPQARFDAEYRNGTLTLVHTDGDRIPADELRVRLDGQPVSGTWSNSPVGAGDRLRTSAATLGETVTVAWVNPEAERSATLLTYEIPVEFVLSTTWNGSSGSVTSFQKQFTGTATDTTWLDQSGYIAWQQASNPGQGYVEYRHDLPSDTQQVDVTIDFTTASYEESGAHVYALANDGTVHTLWCDGSTNAHGGTDENIDACSDAGNSYTWQGTKTATDSAGLQAVYFVVDLQENTNNGDPEELSTFRVRAGTGG
jgi:FlaG/FlaF family flagellin (archaellin)